jgi:hypothetical protein
MSSPGFKKAKNERSSPKNGLWIAPSHSLKSPPPKVGWELGPNESPRSNKFLELADIALRKNLPSIPSIPKKRRSA